MAASATTTRPRDTRGDAPADACCDSPGAVWTPPATDEEADKRLATLAKGLAHPTRVAILRMLLRRSTCVCGEIVEELPYAQSTVSQHLQQLKSAGLIRGEVDGPRVCYCVEPAAIDALSKLLSTLSSTTAGTSPRCE